MTTILLVLGLFLAGMILVAIEAFVLPGIGAIGLFGGAVLVYASFHAYKELNPVWGLLLGGLSLVGSLVLVLYVPRSRVGKKLTLKKAMKGTSGYGEDAKRAGLSVGEHGTASTPLKPSGYAMFGESRVEVHSGGEFIEPKTPIVVVELAAGKVLVEAVSDP